MMIMPGNNLSGLCHYIAGKYPGRIGMLNTPFSFKKPPFYMPYAIDNGCFTRWEPDKFRAILCRAKLCHKPLWVVCPDVVGDAEATIKLWHEWHDKIQYPLAFACQDGMEPQDVPTKAICCFIGGTTDWKLNNAHRFKDVCQLLHIARVSTLGRLKWAAEICADSVDGTGFFRGRGKQYVDFVEWFEGEKQLNWCE